MFTGIIETVGTLVETTPTGVDLRLRVGTGGLDLTDVALGDSIATSGVCLTVTELAGESFYADASAETLAMSVLGELKPGSAVNLEKALTPSTRMGGHMVSGHVDGVGTVTDRWEDGRSVRFRIQAPDSLAKYIAAKGSICVDGISLTVNAVDGGRFDLNIVPHTVRMTTMGEFAPGRRVNLEVDLIARHLERLLLGGKAAESGCKVTEAFLAEHGFLSGSD